MGEQVRIALLACTALLLSPAPQAPPLEVAVVLADVRDARHDEAEFAPMWHEGPATVVVLTDDSATSSRFARALANALHREAIPTAPRFPPRSPGLDTLLLEYRRPDVDSTTADGIFLTVISRYTVCYAASRTGGAGYRTTIYRCQADVCTRPLLGTARAGVGIVC